MSVHLELFKISVLEVELCVTLDVDKQIFSISRPFAFYRAMHYSA